MNENKLDVYEFGTNITASSTNMDECPVIEVKPKRLHDTITRFCSELFCSDYQPPGIVHSSIRRKTDHIIRKLDLQSTRNNKNTTASTTTKEIDTILVSRSSTRPYQRSKSILNDDQFGTSKSNEDTLLISGCNLQNRNITGTSVTSHGYCGNYKEIMKNGINPKGDPLKTSLLSETEQIPSTNSLSPIAENNFGPSGDEKRYLSIPKERTLSQQQN